MHDWFTPKTCLLNEFGYKFLNYILIFKLSVLQSVQLHSRVQLFGTPLTADRQTSMSSTNSRSLLKLMSIESVMPSNLLILCHPFSLLPSIFPSIRVFSNESTFCMRSPTPQFKSIDSLALSLLYSPTLTFIHDYWKNHCFDWTDLIQGLKQMNLILKHLRDLPVSPSFLWLSVSWRWKHLSRGRVTGFSDRGNCFHILPTRVYCFGDLLAKELPSFYLSFNICEMGALRVSSKVLTHSFQDWNAVTSAFKQKLPPLSHCSPPPYKKTAYRGLLCPLRLMI